MCSMFKCCVSLTDLDISNFNFNDNQKFEEMFALCNKYFVRMIRDQNKCIKEEAFEEKINEEEE